MIFRNETPRNKPKIDNSSILEKKKVLQKQFLENTKTLNTATNIEESNNCDEEIQILKLTIKNLKREIKLQDNKNKNLTEELNIIKNSKNKDKNKADEYYNKILELEETINNKTIENNDLRYNLEYNNKQLEGKNEENLELIKENCRLKDKIENQTIKIKNQAKVFNETLVAHTKKSNSYKIMKEKYNELKNNNNILQEEYYLLCEELEKRPVKVETIIKKINTPYKILTKNYTKIDKPSDCNQKNEELFGTVLNCNNLYLFEAINDKRQYLIDMEDANSNHKKVSRFTGYPCKAIITDGIAIIDEIYSLDEYLEIRNKDSSKNNLKVEKLRIEEKIKNGNQYSVLIIGARNKKSYISEIKHMGIENVDWLDSYEESLIRLKYIMNRYDIIICCTSHSSHSATDIIKRERMKDEIKYQIMGKDSSARIKARIRYVIENLNKK